MSADACVLAGLPRNEAAALLLDIGVVVAATGEGDAGDGEYQSPGLIKGDTYWFPSLLLGDVALRGEASR